MVAIFVWAAVILWCIAALSLVSLPFVFAVMHLCGKGNLAKSWWLKIKPRCNPNNVHKVEHSNFITDSKYCGVPGNIYYHR